jgi:hypothetical protein
VLDESSVVRTIHSRLVRVKLYTMNRDCFRALAHWWHTGGRLTASGYANLSVLREGA